jgi:hypothetical protein
VTTPVLKLRITTLPNNYECTRYNRRIVGQVVFFAVHVVTKESRPTVLPRISSFSRMVKAAAILQFKAIPLHYYPKYLKKLTTI